MNLATLKKSKTALALTYITGFVIRFKGFNSILSQASIRLLSALYVQPCLPLHSLSCVRHAQSNLSIHGSLKVPPRALCSGAVIL